MLGKNETDLKLVLRPNDRVARHVDQDVFDSMAVDDFVGIRVNGYVLKRMVGQFVLEVIR